MNSSRPVIQLAIPSRGHVAIRIQKAVTESYDLKSRWSYGYRTRHSIHNAFDNRSADELQSLNCAQSTHAWRVSGR
jgi:hypothetical protein